MGLGPATPDQAQLGQATITRPCRTIRKRRAITAAPTILERRFLVVRGGAFVLSTSLPLSAGAARRGADAHDPSRPAVRGVVGRGDGATSTQARRAVALWP